MTKKEKSRVLSKIKGAIEFRSVRNCDIVIEAITENAELKEKIFKELDNSLSKKVIFASNTSTIPITKLATATKRPDKFIGMHFMNPAPIMQLVEVVRGLKTSKETTKIIKELAKKMGKIPIEVNDYPGFVLNRVIMPMINEAVYCLMEGVASKKQLII